MLFKLSNLNTNFALTLGYLNPALNNSALGPGAQLLTQMDLTRSFQFCLWHKRLLIGKCRL